MPALSIQIPYPVFTDENGQPLEDGYIWIGAANLDPQTSPITVYWDAALTLPAAQPIRTLAGYPSNSGTPGRLYVNVSTSYSIRVQNKNGSTLYSALTATERQIAANVSYTPIAPLSATNVQAAIDEVITDLAASSGASMVGYTQGGTNSVARTVQGRLRDVVSAKDFGATGDGVTDDAVALQNAFDYVSNNGLTLYIPAGNYKVQTGISITSKNNWSAFGDGMYSTMLIRDSFACGTVLNIVSCDHVIIKDMGFDGGFATYNGGSANHAFVFNDCENVRGENLYAVDFKNGGVNAFVTNGTQKRNIRFIGCEVDGLGVANNGINIANCIESGIMDCHVRDCPGSPGYGLQLKNVCERSYIKSSWVEGCTGGVAFGNDISAAGVERCMVSDIQIYNCKNGVITGYASDNVFNTIEIDMNDILTPGGYGVDLQNGSNNNTFRNITGRNVNASRSLVRVRSGNYNTFEVSMLVNPTVASATLGVLDSGVQYTRMNLGQVVTTGYNPWTRLFDDNSGNNTNFFLINSEPRVELHEIISGAVTLTCGGVRILRVDPEGGAATDDLDSILGVLPDNQIIYIQTSADTRDVVVRDSSVGSGNIELVGGGTFTLAKRGDSIALMWKENVAAWCEISRSTV